MRQAIGNAVWLVVCLFLFYFTIVVAQACWQNDQCQQHGYNNYNGSSCTP